METVYKYVLFKIDNHHFALDINSVDRISKLVEITPLPNAPEVVVGIINVQGNVMPVVDIRKRLNIKPKEYDLNDHLIIGHTEKRSLALLADDIGELIEIQPKRLTKKGEILPGLGPISGAIKLQGDVILIHDLESFLSIEEEKMIDKAMKESHTKVVPEPLTETKVQTEEKVETEITTKDQTPEEIEKEKKTIEKNVPKKVKVAKNIEKARKQEPVKAEKPTLKKKVKKEAAKTTAKKSAKPKMTKKLAKK